MFEAAELGQSISKSDFKERQPELHTRLLDLQYQVRQSGIPVIVIVSGVEGAGKGAVVNRLNAWLDTRELATCTFWDETDEERERPRFWRFWRSLPPRGRTSILFGSWYTQPIIDRAFKKSDEATFERQLAGIADFEQMLTADGALIVKFWYHLSQKAQHKRLKEDVKAGRKSFTVALTKKFAKHYDDFTSASGQALRLTDTGDCPWHIIDAKNGRYRDLTTGEILAKAFAAALERKQAAPKAAKARRKQAPKAPRRLSVLDRVDLEASLSPEAYHRELKAHQRLLGDLTWKARRRGVNTVAVFEGWDAAGKGGAIRRLTAGMDARQYRTISIGAPTDEELAHHYLWRFWRHVPRAGYVTIYDRSWYGRVLVERVEDIACSDEWMRAYAEINHFEEQLVSHGVVLLKFWLHISPEEQLRRFKEREAIPWKHHKITEEDWRNRKKRAAYSDAVHDMVAHTSTERAPWHLIAGNDKKSARVAVLKQFCARLRDAL